MASKTLLDYLRVILQLETECRTLSVSMNRNRQQAATLSTKHTINKPTYNKGGNSGYLMMGILTLSLSFLCSTGISKLLPVFYLALTLLMGIPGIVFMYLWAHSFKVTKDENKQKRIQYENAVATNKQQIDRNQKNLVTVNQDYTILQNRYRETCSTLSKYYNLNIVYPKYRNLPAIAMFVQYLDSGRCSQLQGHTGCYNLYEDELRHNIIIAKLDVIIARLDDISASQYEIGNAIRRSNQQIMRLSNQMDITNQHLAVQSYNTQQSAWNTQILGEYIMFRDLMGR